MSPHTSTTDLPVQFTTIVLHLAPLRNCPIDSNVILLTQTRLVKNLLDMSEDDRVGFANAKQEEISFLLQQSVAVVSKDSICSEAELQPLQGILAIKQSGNPKLQPRYRARLVSASNRSKYRHAVHGNAPTVALSTIRTFFAVFLSWIQSSRNDPLHVFTRNVTKAYLQSDPSKRLIYYRPPSEFFEAFPQYCFLVRRAKLKLYGDVEAGLYWHKTFVPWLLENIQGLQQSIYDPSLLYTPSEAIAILLCTDDTLVAIPSSKLSQDNLKAIQMQGPHVATDRFQRS